MDRRAKLEAWRNAKEAKEKGVDAKPATTSMRKAKEAKEKPATTSISKPKPKPKPNKASGNTHPNERRQPPKRETAKQSSAPPPPAPSRKLKLGTSRSDTSAAAAAAATTARGCSKPISKSQPSRRGNQVGTDNSTGVPPDLEVELALQQNTFHQLCFCLAKSQHAFSLQQAEAEVSLCRMAEHNRLLAEQCFHENEAFQQKVRTAELSEALELQHGPLEGAFAESTISQFEEYYTSLMRTLKLTMNFLTTDGIQPVDSAQLQRHLRIAADQLDVALGALTNEDQVKQTAGLMEQLQILVAEACSLIEICDQRLIKLQHFQDEECSILAHQIQTSEYFQENLGSDATQREFDEALAIATAVSF